MSIRKLFALLLALAVLVAPVVSSAAMAASPHHDMAMMEAGHCQTAPASGHHDKMDGKSCCIAMCTALAVAPWMPAEAAPLRQQIVGFVAPRTYHGTINEIATPPPRSS